MNKTDVDRNILNVFKELEGILICSLLIFPSIHFTPENEHKNHVFAHCIINGVIVCKVTYSTIN